MTQLIASSRGSLFFVGGNHVIRTMLVVCLLTAIMNWAKFYCHQHRKVFQDIRIPWDDAHIRPTFSNSSTILFHPKQIRAPDQQEATSKYAYAYLLAGCNPEKPSYRGFFFNILISAHILQASGSMPILSCLFAWRRIRITIFFPPRKFNGWND